MPERTIDQIAAYCEAATLDPYGSEFTTEERNFITNARSDLPRLVERVRELEQSLDIRNRECAIFRESSLRASEYELRVGELEQQVAALREKLHGLQPGYFLESE